MGGSNAIISDHPSGTSLFVNNLTSLHFELSLKIRWARYWNFIIQQEDDNGQDPVSSIKYALIRRALLGGLGMDFIQLKRMLYPRLVPALARLCHTDL